MTRRVGKVYSRSRAAFPSARAAWSNIERVCLIRRSLYVIRPEHTALRYRWRIVRRR